jgi:hypothetical protein
LKPFSNGGTDPSFSKQQSNISSTSLSSSASEVVLSSIKSLEFQQVKYQLQIFLDITFKNYTRQQINDDTTSYEICKVLKQKYSGSNPLQLGHATSMRENNARLSTTPNSQTASNTGALKK